MPIKKAKGAPARKKPAPPRRPSPPKKAAVAVTPVPLPDVVARAAKENPSHVPVAVATAVIAELMTRVGSKSRFHGMLQRAHDEVAMGSSAVPVDDGHPGNGADNPSSNTVVIETTGSN